MMKKLNYIMMPLVWLFTAVLMISLFTGCAAKPEPAEPVITTVPTEEPTQIATAVTEAAEDNYYAPEAMSGGIEPGVGADTRSWDVLDINYVARGFGDVFFNNMSDYYHLYLTEDFAFDKPVYHDYYEGLPPDYEVKNMPEDEAAFEIGDVVQVSLEFTDPTSGDSFRHLSLELIKVKETPNPDYDSWLIQFYGLE